METVDGDRPGLSHGTGITVIRAVAIGSECTGKTTLCERLADHYGTPLVPEFARIFVAEKGSPPAYADVESIARGQIALEDELIATAPALLIQDTDLISTIVYSNHYYGDCPGWIETEATARAADLYLFCDIDVPWVADGDQRDRGERREEMQDLFRQALLDRLLPFIELEGSRDERLEHATECIGELL